MASILVVEQEQRSLEKITNALVSEGWRIRTVPGRAQALQAAAAETPDLVLLSSDTPSADELARAFQRSAGGPGVVVILPEHAEVGSGAIPADDRLARPFSDQDLRNVVRRALSMKKLSGSGTIPSQVRLTSLDIFGDVLAEVEGQGGPASRGTSRPASSVGAPPPRSAAQRDADSINKRLEQTLHGVLGGDAKPRPAPASKDFERGSVEELLSKTLSKLELPNRPRPATAPATPKLQTPTAAPATPPAPPIAPPVSSIPAVAVVSTPTAPVATAPPAAPTVRTPELTRPIERPTFPLSDARPVEAQPANLSPQPAASQPAAIPPTAPALEPLSMLAPELPQPTPLPRAASQTVRIAAPPKPAPPAPSTPRVEEATGTGIKKIGRSTGEFDLSQLDELAYPRRSRPDSARPPAPTTPLSRPPEAAVTQRIAIPRDEDGGEHFGQYTLLEKIAVGGMAEVWKARMRGVEGFQKTVAIKKILPHMTDNAEFVGMFIDEAKLAAQLNHPNIIHIYDLGKISRDYYIAMEFVEGKDLRSLLNAARRQGTSLPMGLALLIASRLADALDYAHNKRDFDGRGMGLVHRDVSPQNVLLSLDGDVKLCDFGIAKAVSKAAQTQIGALKGKLQYMSPEQAWGKAVDQRSDLFSLGAILFEMLTGERLFTGDTEISVLESVRQARVRSVRQVDPSVPLEIDEIVDRALASKPEDRFQTAAEMKQRIDAVVHGLKVQPTAADLAGFVRQVLSGTARDESTGAGIRGTRPAASAPIAAQPTATGTASGVTEAPAAPFAPIAPIGEVEVEEGRKGKALIYALAAILVIAIALGYFFYTRKQGQTAPTPSPAPAAASGPTTAPSGPTGASGATGASTAASPKVDMEGFVGQEVAKQTEAMKQKFEDQKKALEKQIAQADAAKATAAAKNQPAAPAAEPPAKAAPANAEQAQQTPPPQTAAETPRPAASPPAEPAVSTQTTEIRPTEPPAETPRRKEPAAPTTKAGDLIVPGPGVLAPELVTVPKPEYPPLARKLGIQGVVVVSLLVDENGHVSEARVSEPAGQKVGLDEAALVAARGARYKPAIKDGVRVKMWTRLKVPFKL
jgi:TonB family protein